MKIICTICSKVKLEDGKLLPARMRYTAPHISVVEKIAQEQDAPFYILSGKYGLISGDLKIPNYDYYLEPSATGILSQKIANQLKECGITEIHFYKEKKPTWAPYEIALQKGADLAEIKLTTHTLLF